MLERPTITEQFSTFVEFADNRFSRWATDLRLSRNMMAALERTSLRQDEPPAAAVQFWTVYWHKRWRTSNDDTCASLPYGHLAAFMQEPCYWAAHKMARFSTNQYGLADYFQLAIARFDYVLQHFSPSQGSRLDTYAHTAFCNILRDALRQRKEVDICSDWALLRRVSQKRLEDSLRTAGLREVDQYVLAWRCYKLVHTPSAQGTRQLSQPEADSWQAIAREFNRQRQTLSPVPPSRDGATLDQWLRRCAALVRAYLYPQATSLNVPKPGRESGELQDTLVGPEENSLLDVLVAEEEAATRRGQQLALDQVLRETLPQLSTDAQTLLALYYRQGQTQQQIAQALGLKQYTVSRRLSKAREALLKQVAVWSRDTLHISLTTDVVIGINTVLEEWLHHYYATKQLQETSL
ncbi:MAG: sigma-70 family RNA polymerase sigma factor [Elainellaceae cyanobacterium]